MFFTRYFSYKPVALSESDCVSEANVGPFQDLEKTKVLLDFVPPPPQKPYFKRKKYQRAKLLLFVFALAFALFYGHTLVVNKKNCNNSNNTKLTPKYNATTESPESPESPESRPESPESMEITESPEITEIPGSPTAWAAPPEEAQMVDFNSLKLECNSMQDDCKLMMDEDLNTAWKSANNTPSDGHTVTVDLLKELNVTSLTVQPRGGQGAKPGFPYRHVVEVSKNKTDWTQVATGTWRSDGPIQRVATFQPRLVRYVRLRVLETVQQTTSVTINELGVYHIPAASIRPSEPKGGRWDTTLNFPIVPVSAFFNPINGELITLSAFSPDSFHASLPSDRAEFSTRTATWNPKTGIIREKTISDTSHDMFCPGTSFDEQGRVLVTGGTTPMAFSVFDPRPKASAGPAGAWENGTGVFNLGRGYAGQTYVADGTTFMIGGRWGAAGSTPSGDKDGEVYINGTWKLLTQIPGSVINMDKSVACNKPGDSPKKGDKCVVDEWQQHHPWLFAWKGNKIFHAGPSKKMHWFSTTPPQGKTEEAGVRADDADAVCAMTSMYDAENGLILTSGGAPNYHYYAGDNRSPPVREEASANAFEIKLGAPGNDWNVTTRKLKPMHHQRIFASGVILPTGETLVVGGQKQGEPFFENTWQPYPEIYTPGKDADPWRLVAPHITPRVYHSWALLTTNATVIVGGGGLSGDESNRYDAQIYEPPYLFADDGVTRLRQPVIVNTNRKLFTLRDTPDARTIKVTTDVNVTDASLLRYGAVTHTLNNDMRRIKLTPKPVDGQAKTCTMVIPDEPGVALPGYWMLFVLANGVPSKAETVQIVVKPKP